MVFAAMLSPNSLPPGDLSDRGWGECKVERLIHFIQSDAGDLDTQDANAHFVLHRSFRCNPWRFLPVVQKHLSTRLPGSVWWPVVTNKTDASNSPTTRWVWSRCYIRGGLTCLVSIQRNILLRFTIFMNIGSLRLPMAFLLTLSKSSKSRDLAIAHVIFISISAEA